MLKAVKDTWQNAFERTLDNAERASVRDFTNYYKTETDKAIGVMLQKNSISEQDLLGIFTLDGFGKLYEGLYERIGMTFANWYAKNFDKYLTKGVSANQFQEPWRASFRNQGILVGAQRVTLVQNTAKKTLIKVYRQLANDPVFASEGEVVRAKMLRQQFDRYSKYQAERLVRTEATNAANYATMQSAQDIFPGADMQKEWISASDERTRAAHREANGQIVDFNKPFIVKGEYLMRPGDPSGSASNVVNCRCSMAPFPKEAAQTIGLIEDIGFGLNTTLTDETLMSLSPGTQAAVNTIIVEEVAELQAKTIAQAKEESKAMFGKYGINIDRVTISKDIDLEKYNKINAQIFKLSEKYDLSSDYNKSKKVSLRLRSNKTEYGSVTRFYSGEIKDINFGDKVDTIKDRTRVISNERLMFRFKSVVDEDKISLSTITHEMAHIINTSWLRIEGTKSAEFWDKMKILKTNYENEIKSLRNTGNYKAMNEIYIGKYGSSNIDEFFAEGFTEYELSSNPSKYARLIGELAKQYYGK